MKCRESPCKSSQKSLISALQNSRHGQVCGERRYVRALAKNEIRVLQQTGLGALRKVGSLLRGTQSLACTNLSSRVGGNSSQRGTDIACGVSSTVRFVTPPLRREALIKLSLPKDAISRGTQS